MHSNFYLACILVIIIGTIKSDARVIHARKIYHYFDKAEFKCSSSFGIAPGCYATEYQCKPGRCIASEFLCEEDDHLHGDDDDTNGGISDGIDCEYLPCFVEQFQCLNGSGCILMSGVCNLTADCLDGSDEFNCPGKAPEEIWEEHWNDHRENLTLAHADDNVVFYFDSQTNLSITWPIEIVSKAWTYIKKTYWSFEPDPRLFVILHTDSHDGCYVSSYLSQVHGHRNILDCGGPTGSSWDMNSSSNILTLLSNFGGITQLAAKGVFQDAGYKVCENYMRDIVSYDVFTHVLVGQTAEINAWKEEKSSQETNKNNNFYCFRDWALPIYERYGGPLVLERFYSLTYSYGERSDSLIGFKEFNMTQFVHFWSGAAQADLTSLAYTAFDWFDNAEMKKVRTLHPQFSYPVTIPNATTYWNVSMSSGITKNRRCRKTEFRCKSNECISKDYVCDRKDDCQDVSDEIGCKWLCSSKEFTCMMERDCISFSGVCNSTEECADGSDEWNCAGKTPEATWQEHWRNHKENLTLVHADDHVVVYCDPRTNSSIEWPFPVLSEAWKYVQETYGSFGPDPRLFVILHTNVHYGCHTNSFVDERHGHRNVIDCGHISGQTWDNGSTSNVRKLLTSFGHVIRAGAKGVIQNADTDICMELMSEILSYDVYLHVRGEEEILPWKNQKLHETIHKRFYFKNWFLPIYETYGGASVLNKFFSLTFLYGKRSHRGRDFQRFSMQEFIHFWSGAAGADLAPLANSSFGWTNDCEMIVTRKQYPEIVYPLSGQGHNISHHSINSTVLFLSITVFLLVAALVGLGVKYYCVTKKSTQGPDARNKMLSISWRTLPFQRLRTNPLTIRRLDPDPGEPVTHDDTVDTNRYIRIA